MVAAERQRPHFCSMLKLMTPGLEHAVSKGATQTRKELLLGGIRCYNESKTKSHKISSDERDCMKNLIQCDVETVKLHAEHFNDHKAQASGFVLSVMCAHVLHILYRYIYYPLLRNTQLGFIY